MEQTGNGEKPSLMAVLKEKASACMDVVREKIPVYWNMARTKTTETWKSGTKGKVICSSVVVIALALLMMVFIGKSSTADESVTVGSSAANTTTAITSGSTGTDTTMTAVERKLPGEPLFIYTHLGFYMPGYTNCFAIGHEYDRREKWFKIGDRFDPNIFESEKWKVSEDKCGKVWMPLERKIEPFKAGVNISADTGFITSMCLVTEVTDDESDARDDFEKAKELLGSKYELSDITSEVKPFGDIAYSICLRDKTLQKKTGCAVSLALVQSKADGKEEWWVTFVISAEKVMEKSIAFAKKNGDLKEGLNDMRFGGWSIAAPTPPFGRTGEYDKPLGGRYSDFSLENSNLGITKISLWRGVEEIENSDGYAFQGKKYGSYEEANNAREEFIRNEIRQTRKELEKKYNAKFRKIEEDRWHLKYRAVVNDGNLPGLFLEIENASQGTINGYKVTFDAEQLVGESNYFEQSNERILSRIMAHRKWLALSEKAKQGDAKDIFDLAMWYKETADIDFFEVGNKQTDEGLCPVYFYGYKYGKKAEKIRELVKAAAQKGYAKAWYYLGDEYIDKGWDIADKEKGVECYRQANGDAGQALAEYKIGVWYREHNDTDKANEWFAKAAKNGNPNAIRLLEGQRRKEKESAEKDAENLWYADFSRLEKGRLYEVSFYKVLTVRDDVIIATWDAAQGFRAKQLMRKWSGDGGGLIGDMMRNSENASMPDILIKPKREFADGDPILGMKVRYLGILKTKSGAIRAFEEVQK